MEEPRDANQAVPDNWLAILNDACDLDQAFEALEGWDHFHTDTLRGRVRSLQLRPREASVYFLRAENGAAEYESTDTNLLRLFSLKLYCFENALVAESTPMGGNQALTEAYLLDIVKDKSTFVPYAAHSKLYFRGLYHLHQEEYVEAKNDFLKVIQRTRMERGDGKTVYHIAAALAHRALGEIPESDQQLETAMLGIPTLQAKFNMGMYASIVSSILRLWDREDQARQWDTFLLTLNLPFKTILILKERGQRILERTAYLERVFFF